MSHAPGSDDVAQAWRDHAAALADAAHALFASNYSEWIGFLPMKRRGSGSIAVSRSGSMNDSILERHFRGEDVGHLIAMPFHSSPSRMGIPFMMWIAFDLHTGVSGLPDASATWRAATRLAAEFRKVGIEPLVEEYDDDGNYRVWVLPHLGALGMWEGGPYPAAAVGWAVGMLQRTGLSEECLASEMALPGRHHTHDHWSRFWVNGAWMEGAEAVELLLNWRPIPVEEFRRIVGARWRDA